MFELFEFQKTGVDAACAALEGEHHTFLNADEMGTGKTVQALEVLGRIQRGPALVVCPASVMEVWTRGDILLPHFQQYGFDVRVFAGNAAIERTLRELGARSVVCVSYTTLNACYKRYVVHQMQTLSLSEAELQRFLRAHSHPRCNASDKSVLVKAYEEVMNKSKARKRQYTLRAENSQWRLRGQLALMRQHWDVVIFDEVHQIKNSANVSTKACAFMDAAKRLCLTGTPISNHEGELLSVVHHAMHLYHVTQPEMMHTLRGAQLYIRRLKRQVDELAPRLPVLNESQTQVVRWSDPEAVYLYRTCKSNGVHAYEKYMREAFERQSPHETYEQVRARQTQLMSSFLGYIHRLRELCLHPLLPSFIRHGADTRVGYTRHWITLNHHQFSHYQKERARVLLLSLARAHPRLYACARARLLLVKHALERDLRCELQPSDKMMRVLEIFRETCAHDKKMVVMCTFKVFYTRVLIPWLEARGIRCALFCGGNKQKQRDALAAFMDPASSVRVLCAVKTAGALGLNLQAAHVNVCVIMDPHFNAALDAQAAQRIDRIDGAEHVRIYHLLMQGSIDEAMYQMQCDKEAQINVTLQQSQKRARKEDTFSSFGAHLKLRDRV